MKTEDDERGAYLAERELAFNQYDAAIGKANTTFSIMLADAKASLHRKLEVARQKYETEW